MIATKYARTIALGVVAALFILTPVLKADTLTIVLSPTTYNVSPGQSFTINGTLTQSVADSLGSFSVSGVVNAGLFSTHIFDPAFLAFVTGGSSSALTLYSGPMIDLTVMPSDTIGTPFSGLFQLSATDSTTSSTLTTGNVPFTGTIVGAVPEPSSLLLLGTGLLGLVGAARRKRLAS